MLFCNSSSKSFAKNAVITIGIVKALNALATFGKSIILWMIYSPLNCSNPHLKVMKPKKGHIEVVQPSGHVFKAISQLFFSN